ncbi:hypothetical protein QAD02_005764 [Eretmocerus hayati]|uniref:Uncharacterized protein n=1 Tax=Eretmocerus hayati TaxID=131215 RepID=A0ACC2NWA8_9HYME|nr:hypothetical protein QAD02_005764 [Eretmocerus hayati]
MVAIRRPLGEDGQIVTGALIQQRGAHHESVRLGSYIMWSSQRGVDLAPHWPLRLGRPGCSLERAMREHKLLGRHYTHGTMIRLSITLGGHTGAGNHWGSAASSSGLALACAAYLGQCVTRVNFGV